MLTSGSQTSFIRESKYSAPTTNERPDRREHATGLLTSGGREYFDLDQGEWESQPRDQIYTPETLAKINADNFNFTPPNGESQKTVEDRMYSFVENNLLGIYPEAQTVGIFSHGMAIKCLLRRILDSKSGMTYKIDLENTSITRLQHKGNGWSLLSVNDTAHLLNFPNKTRNLKF